MDVVRTTDVRPHMNMPYSGWYKIMVQLCSRDIPFVESWMDKPEPHKITHAQLRDLIRYHGFEKMIGEEGRYSFPWYSADSIQEMGDIMDHFEIYKISFGQLWNINQTRCGVMKITITRRVNQMTRTIDNILSVTDANGESMTDVFEHPGLGLDYLFYLHPEKTRADQFVG